MPCDRDRDCGYSEPNVGVIGNGADTVQAGGGHSAEEWLWEGCADDGAYADFLDAFELDV